ncbi:NAD(P)H-quinone oxidoreductase [Saccharothrix algeriensis]|uniref:NAD(P)H-quinone oxidoreductase n=1 Tax=Saccharothrix algeriensis TaxID=173560 RepID=A0A8T8I6Y2_9PSEU|nr:NAD(P)H-quinone oxidoreductase [Saccharothrix algeriensis]MBM7812017.1 putative PIG3 family NAD(P)H quinone oxidoreductase [Saccharothrix algeriensis]QTR05704.1 NAD(P)H-quinone oxidoreductase [Saccharothrix algeriensis]
MHAITISEPGGPDVLTWAEVRDPEPGPGEVLLEVAATAVNRADLLQRRGHYPPPPGASDVPGLECSGTVAALGEGVTGWQVGDEVCALLAGGGYGERVAVPAAQLLPLPGGVDLVTAASLPEVACTVWSNVVMVAGLAEGETFLVHGGAGGIGTHAIQVAKALGARVATTAGSDERLRRCRELGADVTVNYRTQDFVAEVGEADVVLDNMGAAYLGRNVDVLARDGRLVVIGMQGGAKGELDIGKLLAKRGSVTGTGLRSRPVDGPHGKARIVRDVRERLWPLIASGRVRPVVHEVLPIRRAAEAHRALEDGRDVFGKLVLAF